MVLNSQKAYIFAKHRLLSLLTYKLASFTQHILNTVHKALYEQNLTKEKQKGIQISLDLQKLTKYYSEKPYITHIAFSNNTAYCKKFQHGEELQSY